jgi:signal transduction histidine kinase
MSETNAGKQGRRARRISNLLLNRKFQLKYCFMLVGLSSAISVALGWFLVQQVRENSRMLQLEAELDEAFQAQLADADAQIFLVLVGSFLLFNVLLFFVGVFITHRMAGPIFVLRRYLLALAEGRLPQIRKLRKGDEFKEVLEALVVAADALQHRTEAEINLLKRTITALETQGEATTGLRGELATQVETKRAMLEERTGDLRSEA